MLWEPGKPLFWILQIHDLPTHRVPEGEVGGKGCVWIIESGVREELEETICGRRYRTQKHQRVSFGKRAREVPLLLKSEGVKLGLQSESLTSPISKSEMVESASVTGRFHSSRANTHA